MLTPRHRGIALALAALALSAHGALAQTTARPTAQPVFGGAASAVQGQTSLDFTLNVTEAFDQNLGAEAGGASNPSPYQASGFFSTYAPAFRLNVSRQRLKITVNGGSDGRYYPDFHQAIATDHFVGAGLAGDLTRDTSVTVNEAVTYSPSYLYGLFASAAQPAIGDVVAPAPNYALTDLRSYTSSTTAGITHYFSPRASITFSGSASRTNFLTLMPGYFNARSYEGDSVYAYSIARRLNASVKYSYKQNDFRPDEKPLEHDAQFGLDYTRPWSRTRQTRMGFHVGPAVVSGLLEGLAGGAGTAGVVSQAPATSPDRSVRFIGDAFVDHEIGRTWHIGASYNRGLSYIPGLPAPTYSDGGSAQMGGFLGRRWDLTLSAAATSGIMTSQSSESRFTTYSSDVRLRYAISRLVAASVEGLIYDYSFDPSLILPAGVPHHLNRSGVRTTLSVWLPAIQPQRTR